MRKLFRLIPISSFAWNVILTLLATAFLLAAAFFPLIADAATTAAPPEVQKKLARMVTDHGVEGVTLLVFRHGELLYRLDEGGIAPDARLPIASASKWMTAALIMTLVDDGKLSLDEPIGRRLPDFTGEAGTITLRQLLSFTSGQGGLRGLVDLRQDPRMSLAQSAHLIAQLPLQDKPGTVFKYGSPALQVAGALAEQATGKSWSQLFDEKLAAPLGLEHTVWANPLWPNVDAAQVRNPNLQGGVVTTAQDYGKFLTMLAMQGMYRGKHILSAKAVEEMEKVQTRGLSMAFIPPGGEGQNLQYAFGNWCGEASEDGACMLVASPGAWGTYPWIDRRKDIYGLFFMRSRLPRVEKDIFEIRDQIEQSAAR